jgi:hypothetical protein
VPALLDLSLFILMVLMPHRKEDEYQHTGGDTLCMEMHSDVKRQNQYMQQRHMARSKPQNPSA